jgi:hypothetical protein
VSHEKNNVVDLPVLSAEKLEDMAVEADEQLCRWIETAALSLDRNQASGRHQSLHHSRHTLHQS